MAVARKTELKQGFDAHRLEMIRLATANDEAVGISGPPTLTREEIREAMLARGVRPEDNVGSSDLIRMRHGDGTED